MRQGAATLLLLALCDTSAADTALPEHATRLVTSEIRAAFANVRDDARVQDAAGTRAVNVWHADGHFVNNWHNAGGSGEVRGRWRAHDNMRCITIESGLEDRIGVESCKPMYRLGEDYYSVNPDGTVHGVHRLSPAPR